MVTVALDHGQTAPHIATDARPRQASDRFGFARWSPLVALICFLVAATAAWGDPLDDDTRRLAKQLQCPVCEGVSVADSPSELAGQMRAVIRRKLEQGETDTAILGYFTERYGDGVLVKPPRHGVGLGLWLGPLAVLVAGAGFLAFTVRRWLRTRPMAAGVARRTVLIPPDQRLSPTPTVVGDVYLERAQRELDAVRQDR